MLIRVRTNVGLWRIENLDTKTTKTSHVLEGIKKTRPNVVFEKVRKKYLVAVRSFLSLVVQSHRK